MAVANDEMFRLNSGQLLYNIEHKSKIIEGRIEKVNKKLALNSSGVLFKQVSIDNGLL